MRILVTGASGFIGRHIVRALRARGHAIVAGVRGGADGEAIVCDFARDVEPHVWYRRLQGIDAVVNCAGILRERGGDSFERIHRAAPATLGRAAQDADVARLVQISALGDPADSEFIASKQRGDAALLALGLPVTVLRPSLVYALAGSHGGTSLLRALAAAPFLLPLPGDGTQRIQPIHVDDLASIVVVALERAAPVRGAFEIGGPAAITLREYLETMRAWLGLPRAMALRVPLAVVGLGALLGEWFGSGPLGRTTWRIAQRGLVLSSPAALQRQRETFGVDVRSLAQAVASEPAHTQDRWHARLYPLAPILRVALAAVCLVSAFASLRLTPDQLHALAARLALGRESVVVLSYGGAVADALLGVLLLVPRTAVYAGRALLALAFGYTIVLGLTLPALWMDPLGGLVKNLVLLPAIAAYLVLARR